MLKYQKLLNMSLKFKFFFLAVLMLTGYNIDAQTPEELKAEKAELESEIKKLQGEVGAIQGKLDALPGWRTGALGTLGLNFSGFNDWLSAENQNSFSSTLGFSGNAYANLIQDKYFWRNSGNLNVAWTKLDIDTEDENDTDYEKSADAFNVSSLYGYKLSEKWAASALAEYRSTILNNFNNPGFLDIGVGATWTPINDLVVVFHPLNYNIVFADNDASFESSLGCKIVADYARSLPMGVAWKTNLSAFVSYSEPSDLSNWTWVNGVSTNIFKGLGVGFELGLRANKQESYNDFLNTNDNVTSDNFKIGDLESDDNPLQMYWILGFTYTL